MNIAIDLGGTSVRVALVDGSKIVSLISEPCRADRPENEVLDHICSLIDRLFSTEVKAIGVGVPSVVDAEKGIVYDVVGIPSWKEVHLKEVLEEKYHVPAYINNDCNCFALGVSTYGEARGYSSAVCVTLGTGVGSSLRNRLHTVPRQGLRVLLQQPLLHRQGYHRQGRRRKGSGQ